MVCSPVCFKVATNILARTTFAPLMEKHLIIGLGNVGMEYDATRHNIGFDLADAFVIGNGGKFRLDRHAFVSEVKWKGRPVTVIKPTTFMNLSGKALKHWMDVTKTPIENTLTLVDDLALPLGTLRIRAGGSAAGHNGLKNIELLLQTQQYPRLRFGIGSDFPKGRQVDFVIGRWKPSELPFVKDGLLRGVEAIEAVLQMGLTQAANHYNKA